MDDLKKMVRLSGIDCMRVRMKGNCLVKWPKAALATEASWKLGSKSRARIRLSF